MSTFERWAPWWGLVVVPAAFVCLLAMAYALVPLACRTQQHAWVHVAPAAGLAISAIGVLLSGIVVSRSRVTFVGNSGSARRFLGTVSLATAILFLLATLVQWYVVMALSPCVQ